MISLLQISLGSCSSLGVLRGDYCPCKKRPIGCLSFSKPKLAPLHSPGRFNFRLRFPGASRWCFLEVDGDKDVILVGDGMKRRKRVVLARFNNQGGFGFNGGGGGKDDGTTARVVGNLVLAIGLTYLSMTGQLGWVLDAIVSIWVLPSFSIRSALSLVWVWRCGSLRKFMVNK